MKKVAMMNFKEELARRARQINLMLEEYLPLEISGAETVAQAACYSMQSGGKRLRPMMIQLTCEQFGMDPEMAGPFMAAMEMIHTHSLIHDDLPAMDNDEYRRGRKTTHIVYGEAMAILAGDALLNLAYETASKGVSDICAGMGSSEEKAVFRERAWKAMRILSSHTGIQGMIGGQSVDVEMDGKPISAEQLEFIYKYKTGALISASLMIGAALAGADSKQLEVLEQVGCGIGMAFQIRDDILDVTGDEALLGKPTGSDEKNCKTTWVSLYGIEKAREDVKRYTNEAISLLDSLPGEKEFLRALLLSLADRAY